MLGKRYEIVLESPDGRKRDVFFFYQIEGLTFITDGYLQEEKPSGKRKWRVLNKWSRLMRRDSTIEEPKISSVVAGMLYEKILDDINIQQEFEYKKNKQ